MFPESTLVVRAVCVGHEAGHTFLHLLGGDPTPESVIDTDDRRPRACPQTGVVLQRHLAVVGIALAFEAKRFHTPGHDRSGPFDVAGGAPAYLHGVVRGRGKSEIRVEARDPPHVIDGDVIEGRDLFDSLSGQMPKRIVDGK